MTSSSEFYIADSLRVDTVSLKEHLLQHPKGTIILKDRPSMIILYDVSKEAKDAVRIELSGAKPANRNGIFIHNFVSENLIPAVVQPLRETMDVVKRELNSERTMKNVG